MKLLAFGASSSRQSINRALAVHAAHRFVAEHSPEATVEILDLNDFEMPIFSVDRERETGVLPPAHRFFEQIGEADAILVSYAEHNGGYSAAFKNLFDWTSRVDPKVFQSTPMVAMAASPGRGGGKRVLKSAIESAPHFAAEVVGSLSVPRFRDVFDLERGVLTDEHLSESLGQVLKKLADRLRAEPPPPGT